MVQKFCCHKILQLMVQKSGVHQLRLVVYAGLLQGFYTSQVVIWDFFQQQYHPLQSLNPPIETASYPTLLTTPRMWPQKKMGH